MKKLVGMIVMMSFILATIVSAGDFLIQSPAGTNIVAIDTSGNINASGNLYEGNTLLSEIYWAITSVATPSNGDTTHVSTADQIYDYIVSLSYVANAWDSLSDMVLANNSIYIGDNSDNPVARTLSGDGTINNTGYLTLDASITRDTEIANFWASDGDIDADEISEGKIAFSTACGAGAYYTLTGNDLACSVPTDTTYTGTAPIDITAEVVSLDACADEEIYQYNTTSVAWECQTMSAGGIDNVVEDTTPQLGGYLDVNGKQITNPAQTINMTITADAFIIVI